METFTANVTAQRTGLFQFRCSVLLYFFKEKVMIDRKFKFVAVNPCNKKVYTEENAVVFCAKDKALLSTLEMYYHECACLGCGSSHLESIDLLIGRVKSFQEKKEVRIPDTETDCEIDRCIGGNV